ncbi:DNA primase DnaG [Methanosalsum natronophilum]|uniref:DNA primase DnaG n=1 Tax=Methanosalsum natronophilum TaxID=768733 RepID=UPI0021674530|nr:DNA primase DnaG [Methanosalsum natronophilum]MCS3923925.1 DNA primase [Methanosalsum natronophilum]
MQNTDTTKYIIHGKINADGVIEKPDIVGAIFGQTEGLLGADLDLRDLQKTGRIGRIEVVVNSKSGKTKGNIFIPSSLDRVESSILAAAMETIDRVGPCNAKIEITQIEDVRATKRKHIVDRAKLILTTMFDENLPESQEISDEVRESVRIEEMQYYGKNKIPCGPNVVDSDAIIVVEGRADVLNLLRYGIKNAVCVGGTNVPPEISELTRKKTVTAFTDGDRGGELIVKELLQVADIDYIARAPDGKTVEDLVQREIVRALRQKVPTEQAVDMYSLRDNSSNAGDSSKRKEKKQADTKRLSSAKVSKRNPREAVTVKKPVKAPIKPATKKAIDNQQKDQKPTEASSKNQALALNDTFNAHVSDLSGTLTARLLDDKEDIIIEMPVRDLVNTLKEHSGNIKSIIFDGVITQRILDIAADKGIENLVGAKVGNIAKTPATVNVISSNNLIN